MAKRGRKRKLPPLLLKIKTETLHSVVAVLLITIGVLVIVSFTGQGELLTSINKLLVNQLGLSMLFLPFVFISAGLVLFRTEWAWSKPHVLLGTLLMMFGMMGTLQTGAIGMDTFANLTALIAPSGSYAVFIALFMSGLLIMLQLSFKEIFDSLAKLKQTKQQKDDQKVTKKVEAELNKSRGFQLPKLGLPFGKSGPTIAGAGGGDEADTGGTAVSPDKTAKTAPTAEMQGLMNPTVTPQNAQIVWEYPPLSLLSPNKGGQANRGDVKTNAQVIENTLESFGISAKVVELNLGPAVTQYALEITKGTKLTKITGLATDLALALAAPTGQIRIEAPIPGRSLVGVEVPNHSAEYVTLRTMLADKQLKQHESKLSVALGLNVSGKPVVMDIAAMPHVLIAGATGSGKSVAINAFMCSMLFRASPAEVKFILVDPKRVELTGYNGIPHLLTPVIVEPDKVVSALKWAVAEMDNRYKQLAEVGVKNIAAYNELAGFAAMPSIVIVIDELADVMLFSPSEVEECVTRIAQMARAVGIHLVLATQRPSVDVITGLIKANIPARIAFNVSSMTDSRVILDQPGAEKLLGRGDMLYVPPTQAKPMRIQGTYVSEGETKQLIDFLKSQGQAPQYEEAITQKYKPGISTGAVVGPDGEERDELFEQAAQLFAKYDKASSSLIQRRLSVGYARAARILDQLYAAGLVGPAQGSKPRDVYMEKVQEYLSQVRVA